MEGSGQPPRQETYDVSEPIYDTAVRCAAHFQDRLEKTDAGEDYLKLEELRGRFNQWAAYVGAFAVPKASLDARLIHHENIRDMVLELLYMIYANLDWVKLNNSKATEDISETNPGLPAIGAAIDRLCILSTSLRRSAHRVHRSGQQDRDIEAESLCCRLVEARYSKARKSLWNQLGASIHLRGNALQYMQKHNKKLAYRRDIEDYSEAPERNEAQLHNMVETPPVAFENPVQKKREAFRGPETLPSEVSPSVMSRIKRPKKGPSSTINSRGSTIQERNGNGDDYPPQPRQKEGNIYQPCPICATPLNALTLEIHAWNAHVDQDLEPYVCISEDCIEPLQYFANKRDWMDHMQTRHSMNWTEKVHTERWYCDIAGHAAGDNVQEFDDKMAFINHLTNDHGKKLTQSQIQGRLRRNRRIATRNPFVCPMCECVPEDLKRRTERGERPYDLLWGHIARHLKSLAFLSLSYMGTDVGDKDSVKLDSTDTGDKDTTRMSIRSLNTTSINLQCDRDSCDCKDRGKFVAPPAWAPKTTEIFPNEMFSALPDDPSYKPVANALAEWEFWYPLSLPPHCKEIGPPEYEGHAQDEVLKRYFRTSPPDATTTDPGSTQVTNESISSSDEKDVICYGMLHNIDVEPLDDWQLVNYELGENGTYERFELAKKEAKVLLRLPRENRDFGYLRYDVAGKLALLLEKPLLKFEPIILISDLKDLTARAKNLPKSIVKTDINLYGPRRAAKEVEDAILSEKLSLEEPAYMRPGVEYYKPYSAFEESRSQPNQDEPPVMMLEEVYRTLETTRDLNMIEGGAGVTQELDKHQQEALCFMLERESGSINDRYRLWKEVVLEGGTLGYRHKITGAIAKRSTPPDERGGGILADSMGMGKSLSVLALISKTLEKSREWAQEQNASSNIGVTESSGSTLIVVPSVLVDDWLNEIEKHMRKGPKVIKYHGPYRPKILKEILNSDIVVTTYHILAAELRSGPSLLHQVGWYRVVFDEAHFIRRPTTAINRACAGLHANSRWCVTGTPIQDGLADLGALLVLIRAEPFSTQAAFQKWIEAPLKKSSGLGGQSSLKALLGAFFLRRTHQYMLPRVREYIRYLTFSPEEGKQYENTRKVSAQILGHVSEGEKIHGASHFLALSQLRLICNHGTFQKSFSRPHQVYVEDETIVLEPDQNDDITCSACQLPIPNLRSSQLGSESQEKYAPILCPECIKKLTHAINAKLINPIEDVDMPDALANESTKDSSSMEDVDMPDALAIQSIEHSTEVEELSKSDVPASQSIDANDEHYFNTDGYSTKMQALIEDVKNDLWQTKRQKHPPPGNKRQTTNVNSVIFSCWTKTLDLISKHLRVADIPYLRIDGRCPSSQRSVICDRFSKDNTLPVLLMTMTMDIVGLRLTYANRVFIVELQWNRSAESRALARIIRLGQKQEVSVTRYVIEDTVEKYLLSLQLSKKRKAGLYFENT